MIFHCDKCNRELGTYLYGKGGVEEKAWITEFNVEVNDYDENGNVIGKKKIPANRLPDTVCFECLKNTDNLIS